jgi:hypothetical protein
LHLLSFTTAAPPTVFSLSSPNHHRPIGHLL